MRAAPLLLAVLVTPFLTAFSLAGTFSTDFNSGLPNGTAVYGNATASANGGIGDSGCLVLTPASTSQLGSFIIDDLDPGQRVGAFVVSFKLRMGGGTAPPADGVSFNFAPDIPNSAFNEEGAGSGITITFDTYNNATGDVPEGPEFRVKFGGAPVASRKALRQFQTDPNYVPVVISYTAAGTLNLLLNGSTIFTNLAIGGAPGAGSRFAFGGRTGSNFENHMLDDLTITTTPVTRYYVKGSPGPIPAINGTPDPTIALALNDSGATINPASFSLTLDGYSVAPTVSKAGAVTTLSYHAPTLLLSNSFNEAVIGFSDSTGTNVFIYDFTVATAPLWSIAPGSRPYITSDGGANTPNQRCIAYQSSPPLLYVVSRTGATTGLTIDALDPQTGAFAYTLPTVGIIGGSLVLVTIAVADDGALYAANEVAAANASTNPLKIYRWANGNSNTQPTLVYSGDPGSPTGGRWGDTMAVRGSGTNTQIIMDATNGTALAIFTPTDSSLTTFTPTLFSDAYLGNVVGRSLQAGPTNTVWLKRKSNLNPPAQFPLSLIRYDSPPATTTLLSVPDYPGQVGPVTVDLTHNLAAGIFFCTNASPTTAPADRLIVFDISSFSNPLPIAQYDFPTNHQGNANFIGQVVFGGDRIFALSGNNGLIAAPAILPTLPHLTQIKTGSNLQLSWSNSVYNFQLQSTASLATNAWTNVSGIIISNNQGQATEPATANQKFYRLQKQ